MSKSQKYLSFEARMSYRKNGAIQVTSPDPDLGGFFLTLKKGTESYAIASDALQAQGLMPAVTQTRLTQSELQELQDPESKRVLLGFAQDGEPIYWDAFQSPLHIQGRYADATGSMLRARGIGYTSVALDQPNLGEKLREATERHVQRFARNKTFDTSCIYIANQGHLDDDIVEALFELSDKVAAQTHTFVLQGCWYNRTTPAGRLLTQQMSHLSLMGSSACPKTNWDNMPVNAAWWKPQGAENYTLIELV